MKSKINFSVIIPSHNSSSFIDSLLQSIPTRPDLEVILVDDYSSSEEVEATRSVFNSYPYGKSQFHVNTGVNSAGAARNIGIEKAHGAWLIFADSDDSFTNEFSTILDSTLESKADIILLNPSSDSKKSNYLGDLYSRYSAGELSARDVAYAHRSPWSKIVKSKLVRENGIKFEQSRNANDILFGAKIAHYAKLIEVLSDKEAIYFYSERAGALTDYVDREKYDVKIHELIKRNNWLKENLSDKDFLRYRDSVIPPCVGALRKYGLAYSFVIYRKMRKAHFSGIMSRDLIKFVAAKIKRGRL